MLASLSLGLWVYRVLECTPRMFASRPPLSTVGPLAGCAPARGVVSALPSGPTEGDRMTCTYLLETADGAPADPPSFTTITPLWRAGDTIPLGHTTLRVIDVRQADPDEPPVLVVEDKSE